jgi:esterase/lipase
MVSDSNYGPGMFHEGFLAVVNQLWNNGMQEALDTAVAAGDIKHIIITGHSLGGASTTLLSARAQVGRVTPGDL